MFNTNEYRIAPGFQGEHAYTWKDKPHRLVYDLAGEVERYQNTIQERIGALTVCMALSACDRELYNAWESERTFLQGLLNGE